MSDRLEDLAEILNSYKNDISKIIQQYYSEMGNDIKEVIDLDVRSREFGQMVRQVDSKYEQIVLLRKAMLKIDEIFKEMMFVEDVLKKMEVER